MSEPPRFSFHPLERRGIVVGLQAGQLVAMGAGVLVAVALHGAVGGAAGNLSAVLALAVAVTGAVWTRQGRPLLFWAALGLTWLHQGSRRTRLSPAPLAGRPVADPRGTSAITDGARRPGERRRRGSGPLLTAGVEITQHEAGVARDGYGVIRDRQGLTCVGVLPVRGQAFSLLDPEEQMQRLDAWRTVLAAVARPGSPVVRMQWVQRSGPAGDHGRPAADPAWPNAGGGFETTLAGGGGLATARAGGGVVEAARASYRQLLGQVVPSAQRHETWVALAVGGDRRSRAGARPEVLGRELRFLQGQLRQAGLDPGPALDRDGLGRLLGVGCMAVRDGWSALRIDGALHVTYWVAEWPRVEVGPDFLTPFLMGRGRRAVSLLMAPVAPDRALREVRSARTADLADAELRSRAGFLSSARRDREAEGVARREQELAQGHAEYRFTAYVSVSADDEEGLFAACSELEQSAQASRLELRRLYGRQAEAHAWTLPLGRGLR